MPRTPPRGSEPLDGIDVADRDPRRKQKKAAKERRKRVVEYQAGRAKLIVKRLAIAAGICVVVGLLGVVGLFLWYGSDASLPNVRGMGDYRPRQLTRVLDRGGAPIGELGAERRTVIPYAQIPKHLVHAVISAEDADFFKHEGIDYTGLLRAAIENVIRGRFAQGASTITQQVVKQMLLSPEKTLRRKVQEIILARQLTRKLSKEEILEIYLNQMNFGHGRYGCEEAARYYFGKPCASIDVAEAAVLAGVLQSPTRLTPRRHPEAAKTRQRYVLGQMAHYGHLERATADKLAAQPIRLAPESPARGTLAPEVVDSVQRRLLEQYGPDRIATLGATVKTTIDAKLQVEARQAVERGLEALDERQGYRGPSGRLAGRALEKHRAELRNARGGKLDPSDIVDAVVDEVRRDPKDPKRGQLVVDLGGLAGLVDCGAEVRYAKGPKPLVDRFKPGDLVRVRAAPDRPKGDKGEVPVQLELGPQAAMVVMDPQSREVLALVGGYAFRPGGFDRATRAMRQAGSAFKPLLYAAGIETGRYTAASVVNDSPEAYNKWKPKNHDNDFRGPIRLRVALTHSVNTIAIKLLDDLGLPLVRDIAARAGITSPIGDDLFLSAALGSASVRPIELANAYATFASGGLRAEPRLVTEVAGEALVPQPPQPAVRAETAFVITSMMRSVVEEGTGRLAHERLRRPIAGKTGTTDLNVDAWFVGYTPDLLAAVWVGFDDRKPLGKAEASTRAALPIWVDFMAKALASRPVKDFSQPPGVVIVQIDPATGLLAPAGAEGISEVFIDGTQPKDTAPAPGEASPDKVLLEGGAQ